MGGGRGGGWLLPASIILLFCRAQIFIYMKDFVCINHIELLRSKRIQTRLICRFSTPVTAVLINADQQRLRLLGSRGDGVLKLRHVLIAVKRAHAVIMIPCTTHRHKILS